MAATDLEAGGVTSSGRWMTWTCWGLVALACAILAIGAWTHRIVHDDAFINFRVVDQIVNGNGPVFNAGERVEAFTSPAWLLVLTLLEVSLGRFVQMPWLALVADILLTLVAVIVAARATIRLSARRGHSLNLPVGMLVFAAMPLGWYWAASGLETPMVYLWLAGTFWALVGVVDSRARIRWWIPVLVGCGVLIRPDAALFAAPLLAALLAVDKNRSAKSALRLIALAALAPLAYEVFRAGYYASLVPNTALAKEAGTRNWSVGAQYLAETGRANLAWFSAALVLILLGAVIARYRRDNAVLIIMAAPIVGAVLHLVWVASVGGDFLVARFVMPAVFALVLPIATVPISLRDTSRREWSARVATAASAGLVAWCVVALVAGAWLHPRFDDNPFGQSFWTDQLNPVVAKDNGVTFLVGQDLADRYRQRQTDIVFADPPNVVPARPEIGTVGVVEAIGIPAYVAGPEVYIADRHGLADPIAARQSGSAFQSRTGHHKWLSDEVVLARFAPPQPNDTNSVAAARDALGCGDLRDLLDATEGTLSPGKFLSNLAKAPRLTFVRFASNPEELRAQQCRR